MYKILHKNCAKHVTSKIINFIEEHIDMPNIQNFRKEPNSKNFKKRVHFPILNNATIYKNDLTPFVLVFSRWTKCEDRKKCEMKKYLLISMTFVTVLY